ncbi:MAG: Crp/Fnr family transcriptional regulator [Hyphomicrobiaceae bacterium]
MTRCLNCAVRNVGICGALTDEQLSDFHRIGQWRTYQPGERFFSSQEDEPFVGAIHKGTAKVTKTLLDGRSQIVGLLFPPNCCGQTLSVDNAYLIEALTRIEICIFKLASFQQMAMKYPGLNGRLLKQALEDLDAAQDWMVLLGQKSAEERVASFFLRMSKQPTTFINDDINVAAKPGYFRLQLGRQDMSDCIGLNYDTVCRHISTLKKRNLIAFDGPNYFRVLDMENLVKLAG